MKQQSVTSIVEALHYVKQFSGQRLLIKIGGSVLDSPEVIAHICHDIGLLHAAGMQVVVVHGGSKAIETALKAYQIDWTFLNGQRVTTPEMMNVIEMVLSGHINKALVRALFSHGKSAMGISGIDQQLLQCKLASAELGLVGEVQQVNHEVINQCFAQAVIPVISPVGTGPDGQAVNVNADWAAAKIAAKLGIEKMVYLTDQPGIYHGEKLVSTCNRQTLQNYLDAGIVQGGMMTKVNTILRALSEGIKQVHILGAKTPHVLIQEILTKVGIGTLCVPE